MKLRLAVCGLLGAGCCLIPVASAWADTYSSTPSSTVPISNGFSGGAILPAVEGSSGVRVQPEAAAPATAATGLPLTGGDVAGLSAFGAALVGVGAVLVRRNRARTA